MKNPKMFCYDAVYFSGFATPEFSRVTLYFKNKIKHIQKH